MRESCQRLLQLLEVAATVGSCGGLLARPTSCNMTENALYILIVIFPYNSNKLRPQTESCVFSSPGFIQYGYRKWELMHECFTKHPHMGTAR